MNNASLRRRFSHRAHGTLVAGLIVAALAVFQAAAAEIWNGPLTTFTNLAGSDPTLPSSQDRLAPDIWLTRGATHGLYNAAVESSYSSLSPVGTEWAYGLLSNYASLDYQPWVVWNAKNPPSMVGQEAVLHLIPDDIYLAIEFTSWNIGSGGFSYLRSTPLIPEPSPALVMMAGMAALTSAGLFRSPSQRRGAADGPCRKR